MKGEERGGGGWKLPFVCRWLLARAKACNLRCPRAREIRERDSSGHGTLTTGLKGIQAPRVHTENHARQGMAWYGMVLVLNRRGCTCAVALLGSSACCLDLRSRPNSNLTKILCTQRHCGRVYCWRWCEIPRFHVPAGRPFPRLGSAFRYGGIASTCRYEKVLAAQAKMGGVLVYVRGLHGCTTTGWW
jgi:hypothetical protein